MGVLYDSVAVGMRAYTRVAFRVCVLGPRSFRLAPRTLIVATHRRESDVPVICPPLFFGGRIWWHRSEGMSFAARDDMFLPGFFAGFPPELSPRARRLLYPLGVGRFLPRVKVHPISSASAARAGELARAQPDAPLEDVFPAELAGAFAARAAERGLGSPVKARDVLRGDYADLLWVTVARGETASLDHFWGRRAAQATTDFRELVDLVRGGGTLLVFPEGRPSPDGQIGPLRRGLSALVRRSRPAWFLPLALAYDPLGKGRTRVFVALGPRIEPPSGDVEAATLALLRSSTPLTCGQFVAHELLGGGQPELAKLRAAVEEAQKEGRPVDPDLLDPEKRAGRLADALVAAEEKADELPFLAREYASAREVA